MKRLLNLIIAGGIATLYAPSIAFAAADGDVERFTRDALTSLIGLASVATVFFLIYGGYIYITSTGKPEALENAKLTIKKALLGFIIVVSASVFASFLNTAFTEPAVNAPNTAINLSPMVPTTPESTLTQILLDAISGFLKNIIESATKPILDGIIWFLTSTPSLADNSVVFKFWLIIVGIANALLAIIIALLGFHVMSSSAFGLDEIKPKEIFPRVGLAFLVANTSIFLIDWIITLCQTLVNAVLNATGGLGQAWILNAFDPAALLSQSTVLLTLIFMVIFIILAIVLLLFYISRLMILAFGAVISPLICLLWLLPSMADFARNCFKTYLITIFTVFVHVVIIQLASAFLTVPGQEGANPFISVLVGIALFSILLKSTSMSVQMALTSQTSGAIKKIGGQIFNVLTPATSGAKTATKVVK